MTQPQSSYGIQPKRDQHHNAFWIAVAWTCTVLSFGYMLPWAVAATRGKANHMAIGLLNLLLGWTLIGWIVALVMACSAHQTAAGYPVTMHPPGVAYPDPSARLVPRARRLRDAGIFDGPGMDAGRSPVDGDLLWRTRDSCARSPDNPD